MGTKKIFFAVALVVLLLIVGSSAFSVRETNRVLVLQFGKVVRVVDTPGLKFKVPFLQTIVRFDKRVLDYDALPREIPTSDQKQVVVNAFARYRITNPLRFYQRVTATNFATSEAIFKERLDAMISSAVRRVVGNVSLALLMTPKRAGLMKVFTSSVAREAAEFGVNIIDVRVKRIDLPKENSEAIFKRMKSQREQEARKIRAEGSSGARKVRAEADKQKRVIYADARRDAEILKGEGEAQAQRTYNAAYSQDVSFFKFWRSMQALKKGLPGGTTTLALSAQGDFFRYFGSESGETAHRP